MKASIIVPYRNRESHLLKFIPAISDYLSKANISYEIIVVRQLGDKPFNRALLLNIGYKHSSGDYLVFHDVDMLPLEADYSPPKEPTHIATKCSQFHNKMPYPDYFGGVLLIPKQDFVGVNGYSNNYWGWGGEDDDFKERCTLRGLTITRRQCTFESLPHPRSINSKLHKDNCTLLNKLRNKEIAPEEDGLTTLPTLVTIITQKKEYMLVSTQV